MTEVSVDLYDLRRVLNRLDAAEDVVLAVMRKDRRQAAHAQASHSIWVGNDRGCLERVKEAAR